MITFFLLILCNGFVAPVYAGAQGEMSYERAVRIVRWMKQSAFEQVDREYERKGGTRVEEIPLKYKASYYMVRARNYQAWIEEECHPEVAPLLFHAYAFPANRASRYMRVALWQQVNREGYPVVPGRMTDNYCDLGSWLILATMFSTAPAPIVVYSYLLEYYTTLSDWRSTAGGVAATFLQFMTMCKIIFPLARARYGRQQEYEADVRFYQHCPQRWLDLIAGYVLDDFNGAVLQEKCSGIRQWFSPYPAGADAIVERVAYALSDHRCADGYVNAVKKRIKKEEATFCERFHPEVEERCTHLCALVDQVKRNNRSWRRKCCRCTIL